MGRCQWCQLAIEGPADLERLRELVDRVETDPQPGRYCVRLKLPPSLRLAAEELVQLNDMVAGLRAVGVRLDQSGELRASVRVESLDFDALPAGALRQALLSLREEWGSSPADERREVLSAALQLGWEACAEGRPAGR